MKSVKAKLKGGTLCAMLGDGADAQEFQMKLPPKAAKAFKALNLDDEDHPADDGDDANTFTKKAAEMIATDRGWRSRLGITYGAQPDHPTYKAAVLTLASVLAKEEIDNSSFGKSRNLDSDDTISRALSTQGRR